ncbi:MAG: ATP-binding protein [Spirochaetaceae bacterium]|nr:ATP-binding protein [Spirochaetaceae bacterium]
MGNPSFDSVCPRAGVPIESFSDGECGFRSLFEDSMDAILLSVPDGRIVAANLAACRLFERSERELTELGRNGVVDPTDERLPPLLAERSSRGKACGELRFLKKSGVAFNAEVASAVIEAGGGEARTSMIIRDMTERDKAAKEIRVLNAELDKRVSRRTERLEEMGWELSELAYSVAHDLRAPLRAIKGFARILEEEHGAALGPEGMRLVGVVRENAVRIDALIAGINALFQVSRLEIRSSRVDMRAVAVAMYHESVSPEDREAIDFSVGELPDVEGDALLLKKIWVCILENAIKFTRPKSGRKIWIDAEPKEDGALFRVSDNGVGFDQAYAGKLFKLFQRLHGAEFEGNGVGLAIVRLAVDRHGGTVGAVGRPGEGASFWFRLPAALRGDGGTARDPGAEGA